MLAFFANLFGYVLNFLYDVCKNYGLAMILFSILVKLLMLPLSIKQQKTIKKTSIIQNELKQIQFKYKNDPEKMNQETMALYKRENMSPFSGCLSSIIQIVLLFSIFYLVSSPLTYMKKIDANVISQMKTIVQKETEMTKNYPEIAVIRYGKKLQNESENVQLNEINEDYEENTENNKNEQQEQVESVESVEAVENSNDNNNEENKEIDNSVFIEYKDQINLNMDLFGIDLSKVPKDDLTDIKVLIIPILYVISSFISIKYTTLNNNKKKENKEENKEEKQEIDPMEDTTKMMSWFMPIMSISIACVAPLGLALYWLMNNVLMIIEKFIFEKTLKENENEEEGAIKNG